MNKENTSSNIYKDHFFEWKYLSEGATEDIFLVSTEDSLIRIPAGNHGQKKRRMSDGLLIDRHNTWFGPRKLAHEKEEINKQVLSNFEKVKRLFTLFKASDGNEFLSLGKWWNEQSEEKQCEMLEIFAECEDIKNALAGGKVGKSVDIKKGLQISPEKLVELSKKEFKAPKLSDILGRKKFINLPELGEVGKLAGGEVDKWTKEYIDDSYLEEEEKGGVNLFSLLEKLTKGEHSFKKCSKDEPTKFYEECKKEVITWLKNNETLKGKAKLETPKVVGVVKGGTIENNKEFRVSVGTVKNKTSDVKKWVWEGQQDSTEQALEYNKAFNDFGRKDGIIDVKCKRFDKDGWFWSIVYTGDKEGCEYAWKQIFRGDVDDKRLCLFEIPEGKSYVREYQLTFMKIAYW
ncbi:hypothetical protein [Mycoplasma suis]|uniref:Uncharacterized protein n=2 Tax=Mycoplasma suis TaxID=57372 RepID=F0QRG4_MYCSL|nr:hypothetical protein [Mycoplasma suis]ADX98084.1 hypothetical protein MSU_0551 [Mycoplasma suis str. Illinois]